MTQQELAQRAGVSVRTVRDIEQDRVSAPRDLSITRLAAALGLTETARAALAAAGGAGYSVEVLGPLVVRHAGRRLDVRSPLQRTMLGLLALQPGRTVFRDEIVDVLWGERPPKTCRCLLQTTVGDLRRVLEPDRPQRGPARVILSDRHGYRLEIEPGRLDLTAFDELSARAWEALAHGDPEAAYELAERALSRWRGPVLADATSRVRRHPLAIGAAERRLATVLCLADAAIALARYARSLPWLHSVAREEPLHEGLHARLMLALAGSGQRAAALRTYADIRRRLADELGVDPCAEISGVQLEVLRPRGLTAAGSAGSCRHPPHGMPPGWADGDAAAWSARGRG